MRFKESAEGDKMQVSHKRMDQLKHFYQQALDMRPAGRRLINLLFLRVERSAHHNVTETKELYSSAPV